MCFPYFLSYSQENLNFIKISSKNYLSPARLGRQKYLECCDLADYIVLQVSFS